MNQKYSLIVVFLVMMSMPILAQQTADNGGGEKTEVKQKMPQFPGGDVAFYDFLDKNVQLPLGFDKEKYLNEHHNQFVPVSVGFTVDIDGSIINIKVIDGDDENLNIKAKEIVKKMPKWEPGYQNGSPIQVEFAIPIRFNLM